MASIFTCSLALSLAVFAASCSPAPKNAAAKFELVVREDGVSILKSTGQPYTGNFLQVTKNSVKIEEANYVNGLKHGPEFRFYEDGSVKRRAEWVEGKMVHRKAFWPGGRLKADEGIAETVPHGNCSYWFEDGRLRKQLRYSDTYECDGHVLQYGENGDVEMDAIFDHGLYISGKCLVALAPNQVKLHIPEGLDDQGQLLQPKVSTASVTVPNQISASQH